MLGKALGGMGCAIIALPVLAALVIAAGVLPGSGVGAAPSKSALVIAAGVLPGSGVGAAPSKSALADIPPRMLALYQRAAPTCPGLAWTILAAIGKIESNHGRGPMISTAGALGPMQFLPSTFKAYAYPVPPGGKKPPTLWDPIDAVYAAARLLCDNGARGGTHLKQAIWHYNHSHTYVTHVLKIARTYAAATPAPSKAAATAVAFARHQLGARYVWGGDGPSEGGFDCSGLTKAAYHAAGIPLPRTAQAQYDHGPHLPKQAALAPGDLLFFGTNRHAITHVKLYLGRGQAIDAPHPGARVRTRPARTDSPSYQGATRPAGTSGGGG